MAKRAGTAIIDWLSFTFDGWGDASDIEKMIQWMLREWTSEPIDGVRGNGLFGFEHSMQYFSVHNHEIVPVAVCAWGGAQQQGRIYLSINGTGCSLIKDWPSVHRHLGKLKARITRVDVAVDALQGEFGLDQAPVWYEGGGFTAGGRRPQYKVEGDWLMPQGSGRTFYVGRRQNGKYCRVYEKGKQLGLQDSPWTRFEVEIHNTDRIIPHDVVINPSAYFAGCYPICESLVDVGAERIRTLRAEGEISLDRLRAYCKTAYGKMLYVVRHVLGDDDSAILDSVVQEGMPRRLAKLPAAFIQGGSAPPNQEGCNHG